MFCSCTPEIYKPPQQAYSPYISKGYTTHQNSQPVILILGGLRDRGEKKGEVDFVTEVYSSPLPQPTDAKRARPTRLEPSINDLVRWGVSVDTPKAGVTEHVTQTSLPLTPQQWHEGQRQKDEGYAIIRRPFNALPAIRGKQEVSLHANNLPVSRHVSLYDPRSGEVLRPDERALVRAASYLPNETIRPSPLLPPESQALKVATPVETERETQAPDNHIEGSPIERYSQVA